LARCGRSDPRGGQRVARGGTATGSREKAAAMTETLEAHERIRSAMADRRVIN
jgi:hypothetical protein